MIQRLKQLQGSWAGVEKGNLRCTEIRALWKAGVAWDPPACLPVLQLPLLEAMGIRAVWCDGQKLAFGRVIPQLLTPFLLFTQSGNANSGR